MRVLSFVIVNIFKVTGTGSKCIPKPKSLRNAWPKNTCIARIDFIWLEIVTVCVCVLFFGATKESTKPHQLMIKLSNNNEFSLLHCPHIQKRPTNIKTPNFQPKIVCACRSVFRIFIFIIFHCFLFYFISFFLPEIGVLFCVSFVVGFVSNETPTRFTSFRQISPSLNRSYQSFKIGKRHHFGHFHINQFHFHVNQFLFRSLLHQN